MAKNKTSNATNANNANNANMRATHQMQTTHPTRATHLTAPTEHPTQAMLRMLKTRLLTKLTADFQTATQNSNGNRSSIE